MKSSNLRTAFRFFLDGHHPVSYASLMYHCRHHTTLTSQSIPLTSPIVTIWGSNTGVGKTLFSAGLAAACTRLVGPSSLLYIKPVQTGFPHDSDARTVARALNHFCHLSPRIHEQYGSHAARLLVASNQTKHHVSHGKDAVLKTLFAWSMPVSPHLAVEHEGASIFFLCRSLVYLLLVCV